MGTKMPHLLFVLSLQYASLLYVTDLPSRPPQQTHINGYAWQADFGAFQAASCAPGELDFGDFASFASFDSFATSSPLSTSDDGLGKDAGLPSFHDHPVIPQPDSLTAFGDSKMAY